MSEIVANVITIRYNTSYGVQPQNTTITVTEQLTSTHLPLLTTEGYDFLGWVHVNETGHESSLSERMVISSDWIISDAANNSYVIFTAKWKKRKTDKPVEDGEDGEDGATFTPNVSSNGDLSWTNDKGLPNPPTVNIKGIPGEDGYTPQKNIDYFDGEKGEQGNDGVSATHSWNGTTLTITSASGTSSADLKGEKGDAGADGSFDMANPETTGVFYHKGNGTGNTDIVMKMQSNNGVLTGYGDVSSAFHLGGVPVYFDTLVFFGNGFSFPTPGGTLTGNFTQLKGFSNAEFRTGTTNCVETGCNFDGYPAAERQNFIVKNIAPAGGFGDNWSYQAFNQTADGTWERVFGVKADGTVVSKGVELTGDDGGSDVFIATYGVTPHADILTAYQAGKICYCSYAGLVGLAVKVNANNARFISTVNNYSQAVLSVNSSNEWSYATANIRLTGLTPNTVTVSDASGMSASSTVTVDELNLLSGATGNIQEQINNLANAGSDVDYLPLSGGTLTGHLLPSGALNLGADAQRWESIFGKIYYFSDAANASALKFGMYQWGDNFTFVSRDGNNNWMGDCWQINARTGVTNFSARPTFNGAELALKSEVDDSFTYGSNDLTAGSSSLETGKLYFVYE